MVCNCSEMYVTGTIDISGDKQDSQIPAPQPTIAIVGSGKEKKQCVELGFVDKLIELWRLRRSICEAKAEMSVSGTLAIYTYKVGEAIMSKTLTYKSPYNNQLFKKRNTDITNEE